MKSSYTEEEDYEINKYDSLGFINTPELKYLLKM